VRYPSVGFKQREQSRNHDAFQTGRSKVF
jgi:hypothetical protein